jgi:hypothetical protein
MGYYIFSYGIDTDQIKQSLGSKDKDLFNAVLESGAFKNYSRQEGTRVNSTKIALEHLIFSKDYNQIAPHTYWYAFIAICDTLGKKFESTHEIKLGYETDFINKYLDSDFNIKLDIEETLLTGENSFGMPASKDWPMCGILNRKALLELFEKFKDINISDEQLEELLEEDEEKEMAYDSIRQIKKNISYCLEHNLELISFCH